MLTQWECRGGRHDHVLTSEVEAGSLSRIRVADLAGELLALGRRARRDTSARRSDGHDHGLYDISYDRVSNRAGAQARVFSDRRRRAAAGSMSPHLNWSLACSGCGPYTMAIPRCTSFDRAGERDHTIIAIAAGSNERLVMARDAPVMTANSRAPGRIETTGEPVECIAEAVGFGDAENMRRAFIRLYGQPPQSIRRATRNWKRRVRLRALFRLRPRHPKQSVIDPGLPTWTRPSEMHQDFGVQTQFHGLFWMRQARSADRTAAFRHDGTCQLSVRQRWRFRILVRLDHMPVHSLQGASDSALALGHYTSSSK
jgi:AraC-like DNA-binding protein